MTCPSSTYPTLYCFPANFTFDSLDIVALSIAAAPYKVACTTPSPPPIRPPLSVNNFTRSVSFSLTQPMAVTQPYDALHTSSNAAAAMMYATLVTSGGVVGRGAVPSVQRAANAIRLTALCQQLDNTADTNAANPVPCSDLSDYPLGAPIPVGDEMLGLAAGAAVLNLLLVLVISVGLHVCGVLQRCMNVAAARKHDKGSASKTTSCSPAVGKLLPSSSLPGAIAIAYGVLFQPSLGASITLLAFTGRTARSVVCGVAMLCAWAVFPLYCVYEVVWMGRDCGVFVLESVSQRDHGDAHGDQPVLQWWNRLRHRVMSPQREWRAPRTHNFGGDGAANNQRVVFLLRNMEPVYGGYVGGREWFFIVEWCVTAAGGVVLGAGNAVAADGDVCSAAQWISGCTIGLGCVHAVLCVALRPFSVRLEFWAAVSADVLGVLSQILALAGSVDGASVAVTIAAIAELIVVVLMMLNFGTLSWQQGEAASHDEEEGTLRSVHRTTNKESIEMSAEWQARRLLQRSQDGVGARQSFGTNHAVTYETPFNASEPLRVLIELVCTQRGCSLL